MYVTVIRMGLSTAQPSSQNVATKVYAYVQYRKCESG